MPPLNAFSRSCLALAVSQALLVTDASAATITVGTNIDTAGAAQCSLRDAIVSVNNNALEPTCNSTGTGALDTIEFGGSVNSITLGANLPQISQPVTINGPGQDNLSINGYGLFQIFDLNSPNIVINDLTVTSGSAVQGAGVRSQNGSTVTLNRVTLSNHTAARGAGLFAYFNSSTTLNNSIVTGNNAASYGAGVVVGGESYVTINDTYIFNNRAPRGAGIDLYRGTLSTNSGTVISVNTATLRGGGIALRRGSTTISQTTISSNLSLAESTIGFSNAGAGIYAVSASLTIDSATNINSNRASGGLQVYGGGLAIIDSYNVSINNATITGNSSSGGGGGISVLRSPSLMLTNSQITLNESVNSGGGIRLSSVLNATITNTQISNNSAGLAAGFYASVSPDLTMSNLTVNNNTSTYGHAGGLSIRNSARANLSNSTVSGNSAVNVGSNSSRGSALYAYYSDDMSITNTTFSNNRSHKNGGAIYFQDSNNANIVGSTFDSNTVLDINMGGGAIHANVSDDITVSDSRFSNNSSGEDGGAISNNSSHGMTIERSVFYGNSSQYGGAIHAINAPSFTLANSTLYANSANDGGGILINSTNIVSLQNTTLSGNAANNSGANINLINTANFSLANSIVANGISSSDCDSNAAITSDSNSIIEDGSCNALGIGARVGDPGLRSLANNGGPTKTLGLLSNSIAVNTGDNATCLATDQTGEARALTLTDSCDVGAYEFKSGTFFVIPLDGGRGVLIEL